MRSSYKKEDVVLLLKDITGLVEPLPTKEREKRIQAGTHYCEMLPLEYVPSEAYMEAYREALCHFAQPVADAVGALADQIAKQRGRSVVLVSLARAGTPIGILLKRFLQKKYQWDVPHYSISIIRGRGIDHNAMRFLLKRYRPKQLLFVDGWIGKGAIERELKKELADYEGVSPELAVVADPVHITTLCGTHEDLLIPSACLNSTVSGLISRTFLRADLIGPRDFHGAVFYQELEEADLSYPFIEAIEAHFQIQAADGEQDHRSAEPGATSNPGLLEVQSIAERFGIEDINLVKPGIGETTRVLLRRVPWKVLIDERLRGDPALAHVLRLAAEKGVPVVYGLLKHYKCCGMIQRLADT